MNQVYDYLEGGFHIFPLHNIEQGKCSCGFDDCQAVGKHPRANNWQTPISWDDQQIENMIEFGQLRDGFGVLCDGWLIVDIDPRNGGSLEQLNKYMGVDIDKASNYIVQTGGGGLHIYFRAPQGVNLDSHIKELPGIDFKVSGFVVGNGSLHKSGAHYEKQKGFPHDIGDAPQQLVDALKRNPAVFKSVITKADDDEVKGLLSYIKSYDDYDDWLAVGMAIHNATDGKGIMLWDNWSRQSSKYNENTIRTKWSSFGSPHGEPITIATLKKLASENGWIESVTFPMPDEAFEPETPLDEFSLLDTSWVDVNQPPGLTGDIANHIRRSAFAKCENLATSSALQIMSNCLGMQYVFDFGLGHGETPIAIYSFCVAPSGTGKDHPKNMIATYMQELEAGRGVFTDIKSTKEMVTNALSEQLNCYVIDELGLKLKRMVGKNVADFMQATVTILLSQYSKGHGYWENFSGDVRRDALQHAGKKLNQITKALEEHELEDKKDWAERNIEFLKNQIKELNNGGIKNTFLTIWGATTPETFYHMMTKEQVDTGLIGRCFIFEETNTIMEENTNPISKKIPADIKAKLQTLACGGDSKLLFDQDLDRIVWDRPVTTIYATDEARRAIAQAKKYIRKEQLKEAERETGGLETMLNRTVEMMQRVSAVVAIGDGGVIDVQHVQYAFKLVVDDAKRKLELVRSDLASQDNNKGMELITRIRTRLQKESGLTVAVLKNRFRNKFTTEEITQGLEWLINNNEVKQDGKKYFLK